MGKKDSQHGTNKKLKKEACYQQFLTCGGTGALLFSLSRASCLGSLFLINVLPGVL